MSPQPSSAPLSDASFSNPLDTLGLNREIVREFKDSPEHVLSLAKALYRARSMTAHADKGGTNEEQTMLNQAFEALQDPAALALCISEYVKVTNLQGELDQAKRALNVRRAEVSALSSSLVGMIETSARASLGLVPRGACVETLSGCSLRVRDEGYLLRTGQLVAGDGYDVIQSDQTEMRIAEMRRRGSSAEAIAALEQKLGQKNALIMKTVTIGSDGLIRDDQTPAPRTPSVTLTIPFSEFSRGLDLVKLLTSVDLKLDHSRALTAEGHTASSGRADNFNTTAIPAEAVARLGRYLSKEITPTSEQNRTYLFSSYPGDGGSMLFFLEGRVEAVEVGPLADSTPEPKAKPSTTRRRKKSS